MDESGKAAEQSSITDPNVLVRVAGPGFRRKLLPGVIVSPQTSRSLRAARR
jgi:hypothetical protein